MITLKRTVIGTIALLFLAPSLAAVPIRALAQTTKDVAINPAAPSPKDIGGPNWQDAAKKRKLGLPLRVLPDLAAHAELTDDNCVVNLWIRNNSPNGLSTAQWENPEDTIRVELWDVDNTLLEDESNLTYSFVDPFKNLQRRGGESLTFPWRLEPGFWELRLMVDVTGEIRELTEINNIATAIAICHASD